MKAFLLSALPALASARSVLERNDCTTSILNSTYPQITFGQSRSNIDFYTSQSIRSLVLAVNHSNGQLLDGIPNLPGHLFYWQSQNGWTGVSRNQFQTQNSDLLIDVLSAQNALAREPGDSFGWWGVPLINNYNDDCAWAALSNLQAYEAYGREIFLKRAIAVWQVKRSLSSPTHSLALFPQGHGH